MTRPGPRQLLRRARARAQQLAGAREAGFSTTLGNVLGLLVVIVGFSVAFQVALAYLASTTALSAAQEGARVASVDGAQDADGRAAAQTLVDRGLGIEAATVQVQRGAQEVTVNITATVIAPFERLYQPVITVSQSRPLERLTQ